MLDLKQRLDEPEVQALLALSVFPAPGRLERAVEAYRSDSGRELLGLELDGDLVCCIGIEPSSGTILNIGVRPETLAPHLGQALIREATLHFDLARLAAETDRSAVDFYRHCGFEITSLGEQYPGVERFRCVLDVFQVQRLNRTTGQVEVVSTAQAAQDVSGLFADRTTSRSLVDELIAERRREAALEDADER